MFQKLTYLVLTIAAALTIGAMSRDAGPVSPAVAGFMLWGISAYLLVGILVVVLGRFESMRLVPAAGLVLSVLMLAFTVYVYWIAMDHTSSTEALAYVVVPVYLHIGAVVILAITAIVSKFTTKTT